jgi:hypothetical protein
MSQLELVNRLTGNAVQPSGVSALVSHLRAWTFLRSEGILIVRYQPGGASLDSTKAARPFWRGLRPSVLNLSESNYANRKSSVHNKLCYLRYDDWTGLGKRSPRYRLLHEMIRRRRLCRSEGGIPQRPATQRPPEPALLAGQRDGDRPATASGRGRFLGFQVRRRKARKRRCWPVWLLIVVIERVHHPRTQPARPWPWPRDGITSCCAR